MCNVTVIDIQSGLGASGQIIITYFKVRISKLYFSVKKLTPLFVTFVFNFRMLCHEYLILGSSSFLIIIPKT